MENGKITIYDVAERAGVSIATVSRAMSGGSISAKSRQKVQEAIEALHYQPSTAHSHPQAQERHDPTASVFIGGGYGGMTGFRSGAASTYRLHVGLGLGATEIGLRASIANRALDELSTTTGGAWVLSAEVAHRFLQGATVRPVIGASFDRWQIDPDGRESAGAFGLGARGGVEIHYHLNPNAALVFGADVAYHRILSSVDNASVLPDVLTFGATADIRL